MAWSAAVDAGVADSCKTRIPDRLRIEVKARTNGFRMAMAELFPQSSRMKPNLRLGSPPSSPISARIVIAE
jgi:hypothetical protein